jgi:cell division protein ZipA
MEITIRYVLIGLGCLILFIIFVDYIRRRRAKYAQRIICPPLKSIPLKSEEETCQLGELPSVGEEPILNYKNLEVGEELNEGEIRILNRSEEIKVEVSKAPESSELKEDEEKIEISQVEEKIQPSLVTTEVETTNFSAVPTEVEEHFVALYIMASPQKPFKGYGLLQTILSHHFHYGDMQIFHYYDQDDTSTNPLFSLASATQPGDFDLDKMGHFSCVGLIIFMNATLHHHPLMIFERMLHVATQLAEDLGGEVRLNQHQTLTIDHIEKIRSSLV